MKRALLEFALPTQSHRTQLVTGQSMEMVIWNINFFLLQYSLCGTCTCLYIHTWQEGKRFEIFETWFWFGCTMKRKIPEFALSCDFMWKSSILLLLAAKKILYEIVGGKRKLVSIFVYYDCEKRFHTKSQQKILSPLKSSKKYESRYIQEAVKEGIYDESFQGARGE